MWPPVYNPSAYRTLYSWYSRDRGDNFATSDERWAGRRGDRRSPDYEFVREEGRVLSPTAPQPPGTSPLFSWYSRSRGDNWATTDPRWRGRISDERSGYRLYRLEGYVFDRPIAGTMPLRSWYGLDRRDNWATTDPRWMASVGVERDGYRHHRVEGHVLATAGAQPPGLPERFGAGGPIRGSRPLLVILVDFSDFRLGRSAAAYDALLFGPAEPNLVRHYSTISNGRFTWQRSAVVGPVAYPGTSAEANVDPSFDETVLALAAREGVRFADFDSDSDGVVTGDDLATLIINANYTPGRGGGGQTRNLTETTIGGVRVRGKASGCDEFGGLNLFAHELFHQLGYEQEIYGPGGGLNWRASLFAGSPAAPDHRPIQLDPWHAMRSGWLSPRIFAIGQGMGSGYLEASAVHELDSELGCLIFYDPARGTDEYLMVEFRHPSPLPGFIYDSGTESTGVAVWYVKRRGGELEKIFWPPGAERGGTTYAHYLLGPRGPAMRPYWTASHGEFAPAWPDGADTGLRLRVGRITGPKTAIQWRSSAQPFAARVDDVRPSTVAPGAWITIDGMFAVDPSEMTAVIDGPGGRITLAERMETSTAMRLTCRIPDPAPAGDAHVVVLTGTVESNPFPIRIRT